MKQWIKKQRWFFLILGFSPIMSVVQADPLTVSCPHQDIHFEAELALTPKQHATGLMFRKFLPKNEGMLFFFPDHQDFPPSMWMKNTYIPLDMMFADENGVVLHIFENTTPLSTARIGPVRGTAQVFEVNAGVSKKQGIKPGCILTRLK